MLNLSHISRNACNDKPARSIHSMPEKNNTLVSETINPISMPLRCILRLATVLLINEFEKYRVESPVRLGTNVNGERVVDPSG